MHESSAVIYLDEKGQPEEAHGEARIDVRCPAGHALSLPAAEAARDVFCPQCRKAFAPGAGPVGEAPAASAPAAPSMEKQPIPAPVQTTLPADPAHPAGPVSPRVFRRVVGASGWVTSGVLHAVLFTVIVLLGARAVPVSVEREVALVTTLQIPPPEEKRFEPVRRRDIFRRESPEPKGARDEDRILLPEMPAASARPSETAEAVAEPPSPARTQPVLNDDLLVSPASVLRPRSGPAPAPIGLGGSGASEEPGPLGGLGTGATRGRATAESRLSAARKGGGGEDTESAVEKALEWLAKRQEANGSWRTAQNLKGADEFDPRCDLATTGLAALAFLGAGYDHRTGKYKDNVGKALDFLIYKQTEVGCWTRPFEAQEMHAQGIAALALAEGCLAAPKEAGDDAAGRKLREAAQRAVQFIVDAQYPYSAWGYTPYAVRPNAKGPPQCVVRGNNVGWNGISIEQSVVIWNGMALKAARTAGLKVDGTAFSGMVAWLDSAQGADGNYAYSGAWNGSRVVVTHKYSSPCMAAAALMMRLWTGARPNELGSERTATVVLDLMERSRPGGKLPARTKTTPVGAVEIPPQKIPPDLYFLHHGSIAMFQMGGDRWVRWNKIMKPLVLESQNEDGSWNSGGAYVSGQPMSTALGALILESYYRYSPLYR